MTGRFAGCRGRGSGALIGNSPCSTHRSMMGRRGGRSVHGVETEDTDTPYPGRWWALGVLTAGFALPTMIGAR